MGGLASCNDIQALDRLSKPSKPVTHCPATARCVHWTSRFTSGCPGGCGHGASNIYTSSYCVATNGAAGSDSECAHRGLPRPAASISRYCGLKWPALRVQVLEQVELPARQSAACSSSRSKKRGVRAAIYVPQAGNMLVQPGPTFK